MKFWQLITFNRFNQFEQSFYNELPELIEDMENLFDDFPSAESEIKEFIVQIQTDMNEESIIGQKLEFEDKSFILIEMIDTEEINKSILV